MATSKNKTRFLVSFKNEDLEQLDALVKAFQNNDIQCSRSLVLTKAFHEYLKAIVLAGQMSEAEKEEKKDA